MQRPKKNSSTASTVKRRKRAKPKTALPAGRTRLDVTLAELVKSLGNVAKTAKWAGVSVRTIRDWMRRGVPPRALKPLLVKFGRRKRTLRQWELRRLVTANAILVGIVPKPPREKFRPERSEQEVLAQLEFQRYLRLQKNLATTRDLIEGFDRIRGVELPDLTDEQHAELRNKMRTWRRTFEVIRAKRLAVSEFPELRDATANTIDEIARLLAEKHDKPASYFYKKWHTP